MTAPACLIFNATRVEVFGRPLIAEVRPHFLLFVSSGKSSSACFHQLGVIASHKSHNYSDQGASKQFRQRKTLTLDDVRHD